MQDSSNRRFHLDLGPSSSTAPLNTSVISQTNPASGDAPRVFNYDDADDAPKRILRDIHECKSTLVEAMRPFHETYLSVIKNYALYGAMLTNQVWHNHLLMQPNYLTQAAAAAMYANAAAAGTHPALTSAAAAAAAMNPYSAQHVHNAQQQAQQHVQNSQLQAHHQHAHHPMHHNHHHLPTPPSSAWSSGPSAPPSSHMWPTTANLVGSTSLSLSSQGSSISSGIGGSSGGSPASSTGSLGSGSGSTTASFLPTSTGSSSLYPIGPSATSASSLPGSNSFMKSHNGLSSKDSMSDLSQSTAHSTRASRSDNVSSPHHARLNSKKSDLRKSELSQRPDLPQNLPLHHLPNTPVQSPSQPPSVSTTVTTTHLGDETSSMQNMQNNYYDDSDNESDDNASDDDDDDNGSVGNYHSENSHASQYNDRKQQSPGQRQQQNNYNNNSNACSSSNSDSNFNSQQQQQQQQQKFNNQHIKKPLNPFMIYMQKMRKEIISKDDIKESAAINRILGQRWQKLSKEEQQPYYELARQEKILHSQKYPGWSARDNYANQKKKKKLKLKSLNGSEDQSDRKCRARFGLQNQAAWCKPCKRKKKCIMCKPKVNPANATTPASANSGPMISSDRQTANNNNTNNTNNDNQSLINIQDQKNQNQYPYHQDKFNLNLNQYEPLSHNQNLFHGQQHDQKNFSSFNHHLNHLEQNHHHHHHHMMNHLVQKFHQQF